jgi:hypothetical protein
MSVVIAMSKVIVKGTVARGHRVTVDVPSDWPEGSEVEAVVRSVESDSERVNRNRRLVAFLRSLQNRPGREEPTREELDKRIQEERDSWND